jgi:rubrerythrin
VTRSHFDKLVNEFEKGLDEALKEYDVPMLEVAPSLAAAAAEASSRDAKGKAAAQPSRRVTRSSKRRQDVGEDSEAMALEEAAGFWQCRHCTYANEDMDAQACEVCGQPRRGANKQ